jgi:predicted ATPase
VPTGTVTFLFSDVVGSTRLWAADAEAMSASLRIHDQIFRDAFSEFDGYVFATAGDSFAAAFARASAAVDCAEAIQAGLDRAEWGAWPALRVRIGLHVGEAEERDGNYFGPAVNQTARVMAIAHGGQVLMTAMVHHSAAVTATDLGVHVLRDIETPVHLHQLGTVEFPPLLSVGKGIVSLPSPRTSLVGREAAVEEVRKLVGAHRLVTLTGVGGCGKTRLAIEVAYREVPSHPDGVWFVDLSTIADEGALPGAFATGLALTPAPGTDPIDEIAVYLAARDALLVVDNCEHVIDAAAACIDRLLGASPALRVLVTSRESLELDGEFTWKVPSLATGEDAPATQLFIDRANAVGGALRLDDATLAMVAEIVVQLDGIPLAIELAAARTRSMDIVEIHRRLDDRFRLLSGGTRRSRQRQATLEGAVQWSYGLLTDAEQSMLRTLSVFQGGFSVADAGAVAGLAEYEAIDLIDALAAKSLVDLTRDIDGHVRHRLLETIRLFALSRLIDLDAVAATRDRHLDQFHNDNSPSDFERSNSLSNVVRRGQEYENYRSAGLWAIERGHPEQATWIAAAAFDAAGARGELPMIIDWLTAPAEMDHDHRIASAATLGWVLAVQGDIAGSETQLAAALAIGHLDAWVVFANYVRSLNLILMGDMSAAEQLIRNARAQARDVSGPILDAVGVAFLAILLTSRLAFEEAIDACDAAMADAPEMGYYTNLQFQRAWALLAGGHVKEAVQAVETFNPVPSGSQFAHLPTIATHAVMAHTAGSEAATRSFAATIAEAVRRRPAISPDALQTFGYLAHIRGDTERAAEIVDHNAPFMTVHIWSWMVLTAREGTAQTAHDVIDAYNLEHPIAQRYERFAQHGARLLAEELERWT